MSGFQALLVVAVVFAVVAAASDHKTGLIPNLITHPLAALGTIAHMAERLSRGGGPALWTSLAEIVAGGVLCGVVPLLLWRSRAMGGGDVKLLIGLGLLLGPSVGLSLELYAFMTAALIAPLVLAHRGVLSVTLKRSLNIMVRPFRQPPPSAAAATPNTELRFGGAIFVASLMIAVVEWRSRG